MPKLNCPVPGCSRKGRDGYSAQKRVNIHLRGPSHSISLEKGKGGDMEALRQRQERDFRAWCQGHGHPADTPLFPASDEDEEEDDLGRDSDDLNTDAGFTKSTTGQEDNGTAPEDEPRSQSGATINDWQDVREAPKDRSEKDMEAVEALVQIKCGRDGALVLSTRQD